MEEKIVSNKLLIMMKGIMISMIVTIVMILVLSIILSFSNVQESVIIPSVIFISTFSILLGAFLITKKIDEKGIVYGSLLGVIYMSILYLISSIINFDFSLHLNSIIMIVLGVVRRIDWWNFRCKY